MQQGREEAKNDFGIDGEIELTETNEAGKRAATGKILKLQLKSTRGGYLGRETDTSFQFIAKKGPCCMNRIQVTSW